MILKTKIISNMNLSKKDAFKKEETPNVILKNFRKDTLDHYDQTFDYILIVDVERRILGRLGICLSQTCHQWCYRNSNLETFPSKRNSLPYANLLYEIA